MSEKIFWRYFALFSPQDVSRDLWRGRRQAVDHLGADLIQDLVLETVLLRTSNCISSGFCLYFFAFLWVCTAVYIVACFRLFYSSLTRWGFHTPVKQMVMTIVMMGTGEKLVWVWVWVGNSKLVMENIGWWFLPEMLLLLLEQQQTDKGNCNMILIYLQSRKADTQLGKI